MSSAIWTLTLLTLASSGLCEIPAPVNLSISSHNFIHLLKWKPGPGSPVNLSYTVDVHCLGEAIWLNVPGCEEVVSPLVCNLTGALPDLKDTYYPRVQAKLGNQSSAPTVSEAFIPIRDTVLDPPSVSISVCGDSLCVGLSPPSSQLREVYSSLSYTLNVSSGEDGAQYTLSTNGLAGEKIKYFEPGRKYCITARIADRKPASSQPQCIVVPYSAVPADREISIVLCMLVIVVLMVMLLLFYTGFICLRLTLPESLVLVQPQDVHLLPLAYDPITCSLLLVEGAAGGQKREGGRNSACEEGEEEAEEIESQGTGSAGYERTPGRPNGISSSGGSAPGGPPLADGRFPLYEPAGCRDASLTGTRGQDSSGSVTDRGPPLSSLSGKGPSIESAAVSAPPSECATADGPLSLTLTGGGPLSAAAVKSEAPSSRTASGPRRASGDDGGTVGALEEAEGRPAAELPQGERAEEEEEEEEGGSGLNVNLLSVMLAGQEEEEEEEEGAEVKQEEEEEEDDIVNEHKPLLLGVSSDPLPVLPLPAAVTVPPHTQACIYSEEEEEEEEEDDDEDDDDDEECSGYMRRAN